MSTIQETISKATKVKGPNILRSKDVLCVVIGDLSPDLEEELKFINRVYNDDVGKILYDAFIAKDTERKENLLKEADRFLDEENGRNLKWRERLLSYFWNSIFGIPYDSVDADKKSRQISGAQSISIENRKNEALIEMTAGQVYEEKGQLEEAFKHYYKAAAFGDAKGEFYVGYMYENGLGVPSDRSEAIKWYRKAAEKGHDGAKDRLLILPETMEEELEIRVGRRCSEGLSVKELYEFESLSDPEEITTWLEKHVPNFRVIVTEEKNKQKKCLAENAQKEMAAGETCEKKGKLEEAFRHYYNAADFGDAKGAFYVGYMYERGEGVQRNIKSAVEWYTKSAKMGNRGAQHNLGFFYYSGTGVEQNLKLAYEFFMMAAKQGKADSMLNIGVMYENGEYVAKDYHKALEWYRKAADNGNSDGERFYNAMRYRMNHSSH